MTNQPSNRTKRLRDISESGSEFSAEIKMGKNLQDSTTDGTFRPITDEKSNIETTFYTDPPNENSKNPPVYEVPPIHGATAQVAPVIAQPTTGYIQVQPVVTAAPVNNYTSMCECNDLWCSFCWLRIVLKCTTVVLPRMGLIVMTVFSSFSLTV